MTRATPIYLDHAATSWPKPPEVLAEIALTFQTLMANSGRSGHAAALESARRVFQTRAGLARLLGAARSDDVILTHGCTESINLVLKGWLRPHDRVWVSPLEHNAVMRPLLRLQRERGLVVETLAADPRGRLDLEALRRKSREAAPRLAIVQHASNVHGVVQDLAAIRQLLPDCPLLVDAAQTLGVLPLDVSALRIDFLAAGVHKGLLGPTGVGVAYLAPDRDVAPLSEGGTGSRSESLEQPTARPDRYESGTPNLHGIAGTLGALRSQPARGLLGGHKTRLVQLLVRSLAEIEGVELQSDADGTALCASFRIRGASPDRVALRLERQHGILCRPGLHCAPAAHRHLGTWPVGTVRMSPGWGTTEDDLLAAAAAVREIACRPE